MGAVTPAVLEIPLMQINKTLSKIARLGSKSGKSNHILLQGVASEKTREACKKRDVRGHLGGSVG